MDDVKEFVKKYWPYILGGIVGLFLLMRSRGGSSGGDSTAAFFASQAALGQSAQQAAVANAQIQSQERKDLAQIAMQRDAIYAESAVGYLNSQAAMAKSVGDSAAGIIAALSAPNTMAIQAAAVENAAALQAAGNAASASFLSQSNIVAANQNAIGQMAGLLSGGTAASDQAISAGAGRKPTFTQSVVDGIGAAYSYGYGGYGARGW